MENIVFQIINTFQIAYDSERKRKALGIESFYYKI